MVVRAGCDPLKPASPVLQGGVRASLPSSEATSTVSSIAGPNRDLGLDEPEVNACRDAVSPAGSAGSSCSEGKGPILGPVREPSTNPVGSVVEAGSSLEKSGNPRPSGRGACQYFIRVTEDDGSQWVDAETFDQCVAALKLLAADVQDYPAWQRKCHALDVARAAIARATGEAA